MVFNAGGYRVSDFLRMGTPLTLLVGSVTVMVVPLCGGFSSGGTLQAHPRPSYPRRAVTSRVARKPSADYRFHGGAAYAHDFRGYDKEGLDSLPRIATERSARMSVQGFLF
jgi:hypothetical protein